MRQIVRSTIPFSAYRKFAGIYNHAHLLLRGEAKLLAAYRSSCQGQIYPVYIRAIGKRVWVRGGSPDVECLVQNLVRGEYRAASSFKAPGFVIDAGGYIGDTALFFQKAHPDVPLVVLEPDSENFAMCERNLRGISKIDLMQVGLGCEPGYIGTEGSYWSARSVRAASSDGAVGVAVPVISVDELIRKLGFAESQPGILKMDIEGAETEVLNDRSSTWPEVIGMLLVETHGQAAVHAVERFAAHYRYSIQKYRSIHILRKVFDS